MHVAGLEIRIRYPTNACEFVKWWVNLINLPATADVTRPMQEETTRVKEPKVKR